VARPDGDALAAQGRRATLGRRLWRDVTFVSLAAIVLGRAFGLLTWTAVDFHAYYVADLGHLYDNAREYYADAFVYTPLFAQLTAPLRLLPYDVALAAWTALELGALYYLVGRWTLVAAVPLAAEWINGNVHLLMAAAVVWGMRNPGGWLVPAMTKVSPIIGLTWFAIHRQWRHFLRSLALVGLFGGVSFLIAPQLWFDWLHMLATNVGATPPEGSGAQVPLPLGARLALAGGVLLIRRPWAVPLACALALPVLWVNVLMAFGLAALTLRQNRARMV